MRIADGFHRSHEQIRSLGLSNKKSFIRISVQQKKTFTDEPVQRLDNTSICSYLNSAAVLSECMCSFFSSLPFSIRISEDEENNHKQQNNNKQGKSEYEENVLRRELSEEETQEKTNRRRNSHRRRREKEYAMNHNMQRSELVYMCVRVRVKVPLMQVYMYNVRSLSAVYWRRRRRRRRRKIEKEKASQMKRRRRLSSVIAHCACFSPLFPLLFHG